MSATAYSRNSVRVCYKCFVAPSIWKLSIRPSDASAKREIVVEADTWPAMIDEVRLVIPDLLELSGQSADKLSLTFKAEEHLDLTGS